MDLIAWLAELERRHGQAIELGLECAGAVYRRLDLDFADRRVITVGGTNGKGSVVAYLEAACRAAGRSVFAYTSPHIRNFTERVHLDGVEVDAESVSAALDRVEAARGDTRLTYFEHITLGAFCLAHEAGSEVLVLEVGLGGRLDVVNLVDADIAVITSIGLDHAEYLGNTRGEVAREKAGIARRGRPVVVGDREPPPELDASLAAVGAKVIQAGRDFDWRAGDGDWILEHGEPRRLPLPAMGGTWQLGNAACAAVALDCLPAGLRPDTDALAAGLGHAVIPGRFQIAGKRPDIIVDVAHNPDAAKILATGLSPIKGRTLAVFACLADKDAAGIVAALAPCIDAWYCAGLAGDRGRDATALAGVVRDAAVPGQVEALESVSDALAAANDAAGPEDRIVVFGSFHTVAQALDRLDREQ